jgi:hypothetical protein
MNPTPPSIMDEYQKKGLAIFAFRKWLKRKIDA